MNVIQLIDDMGGTTAAAKLLGVRPNTVTNWKSRGRIPAGVILNNPKLAIRYMAEKEKASSNLNKQDIKEDGSL